MEGEYYLYDDCAVVNTDRHSVSYVQGDARNLTGDDLVREAGGGIVVVTLEYRLGIFGERSATVVTSIDSDSRPGFLAGQQVKQKGALNLGLRKY